MPLTSRKLCGSVCTSWKRRDVAYTLLTKRKYRRSKNLCNSCGYRDFLVETAGLEPVTSCV